MTSADADALLLDYAAARGVTKVRGRPLSGRQFKRWRSSGVMPPRSRRGAGRGPGLLVRDPSIAAPQLIVLCQLLERTRSLLQAAPPLWYLGYAVKPGLIQLLVAEVYRQHRERPKQGRIRLDDAAYEEAHASTKRLSARDQRLAARLTQQWDSPFIGDDENIDDELSQREILTSARNQVAGRLHGLDPASVDPEQVAILHGLDEFDGLDGRPDGHAATQIVPRMLQRLTDTHVIEAMARLSAEDLESIRVFLLGLAISIRWLRAYGTNLDWRSWAERQELGFDPSDPTYSPTKLLVTIGGAAVEMAEFQPDYLPSLQVESAA